MSYKSFYTNFELGFEKKALAKFIYTKQIVRSSAAGNVYTIDNFVDTTNIISRKLFFLGSSFYSKRFLFVHKKNKNLRMNSFLSFSYIKKTPVSLEFYDNLKILESSKISEKLMFLLNPVKGGFRAYAFGVIAFIPRSQCHIIFVSMHFMYLEGRNTLYVEFSEQEIDSFFFKSFLEKLTIVYKKFICLKKTQISKNFENAKFLIDKNNLKKKYLTIKFSFFFCGVTIYSKVTRKNFSKVIRRRKKCKNFMNFVFVSKKKLSKNK